MQSGSIGTSQEYRTVYGVVRSMKPVQINSEGGAAFGGILGSTIGGGSGRALAITAGAAGEALAGGAVGNKVGGYNAHEVIVESNDGNSFFIVEHESVNIAVGQRVRLLIGSKSSRIEPL